MKTLQKFGGFAALYLAAAYLIGIILFIVVLDYLSITDPAQKVALNVDKQMVIFSTNLLMYVFFGFFLIILSLALYDRLKSGAPAIMQVATAIGIIWAGSLIASGMVANAGLAAIVPLYAKDPAQAALTWQGIEAVSHGLGNGNGEILGGLIDAAGQPGRAAGWRASQGTEHSRLVGWRSGHHLNCPRVDRDDGWNFWLEPNHLVHLAGDCSSAQQPRPGSVIPTAFSTSSFNSKQEYWRG